mmetsp:Transcript_20/g.71  ORF Transcript_20/g.71 Transcript_20/m.71 type:complete len:494 (-) Transcript_20:307-1788(-)
MVAIRTAHQDRKRLVTITNRTGPGESGAQTAVDSIAAALNKLLLRAPTLREVRRGHDEARGARHVADGHARLAPERQVVGGQEAQARRQQVAERGEGREDALGGAAALRGDGGLQSSHRRTQPAFGNEVLHQEESHATLEGEVRTEGHEPQGRGQERGHRGKHGTRPLAQAPRAQGVRRQTSGQRGRPAGKGLDEGVVEREALHVSGVAGAHHRGQPDEDGEAGAEAQPGGEEQPPCRRGRDRFERVACELAQAAWRVGPPPRGGGVCVGGRLPALAPRVGRRRERQRRDRQTRRPEGEAGAPPAHALVRGSPQGCDAAAHVDAEAEDGVGRRPRLREEVCNQREGRRIRHRLRHSQQTSLGQQGPVCGSARHAGREHRPEQPGNADNAHPVRPVSKRAGHKRGQREGHGEPQGGVKTVLCRTEGQGRIHGILGGCGGAEVHQVVRQGPASLVGDEDQDQHREELDAGRLERPERLATARVLPAPGGHGRRYP